MNLRWLVWKDYRANRLIFIVTLVLLLAPHAMAVIGLAYHGAPSRPFEYESFVLSSMYAVGILQLTFALLGGNLIAGERVDRSAEFLAQMPVSRGRNLVSKLLVALTSVPLVWLPNLLVVAIVAPLTRWEFVRYVTNDMQAIGAIAVTGLTFFCVAWLFSSMLESPTISVCAGLIAPLLIGMGMGYTAYLLKLPNDDGLYLAWYCGLCLAISAVSFTSGTLYYLRRVEP